MKNVFNFHLQENRKGIVISLVWIAVVTWSCNRADVSSDNRQKGMAADLEEVQNVADDEITNAINIELQLQDGVEENNIDVRTEEGIVTLSGEQDNLLAKERAANIAEIVKGVKGVINKIDVSVRGTPDSDVHESVEEALRTDPATDDYKIDVRVKEGEVTLEGEVETWQEKQLLATVAKSVEGVTAMNNNLDIRFESDRTDMEMERAIKRINHWDIRVDDGMLTVNVEDGEAVLSGIVGSLFERNEAIANAWVEGIKSVETEDLRIERWARDESLRKNKYRINVPDEEIKQAINDVFIQDPRVNPFNPSIQVEEGAVTLTGVVDNLKAKEAAETDAKNVVGVWKVNNLLKVRNEEERTDTAVANDIRESIAIDPYLERYEVTVSVNSGIATLTGVVDNYLEKYKAYDAAAKTKGVYRIDNNIIVDNKASPYVYDFNTNTYNIFPRNYNYVPTESDVEIEDDIERQIWWSPFVNLDDVDVEVEEGRALLTGSVDSWLEYNAAEQNAYDGGAIVVNNNLTVQY